jgi:undecaprenyl diphosphate synthase
MVTAHPNHILLIPDGNRRYAIERGITLIESYKKASEKATKCLEWFFRDFKIPVFSAYSVSLDNMLKRSENELEPIYRVQVESYKKWLESSLLEKQDIKVKFIGEIHILPDFYQEIIKKLEKATQNHKKHQLFILAAYSGKLEIIRAIKRMANEKNVLKNNLFNILDKFYKYLEIRIPVDCVIRTASEKRISDSLVYQSSHAEFCSISKYFPEITKGDIERVLLEYSQRKRRFGE